MTDFDSKRAEVLVELALEEDLGTGDVTTEALSLALERAEGWIRCKEDGVLAGAPVAERVFRRLDPSAEVTWHARDGDAIAEGDEVARIHATARALLAGERTALNFLQRLSGIATTTRAHVRRVEGTGAVVLDTRKTTPGWRDLEKYAVRVGGAANHRAGLYDQGLFKENHLDLARRAGESLGDLVARVRERTGSPVEVEVRSLDEAREARAAGAEILMLDNFDPPALREAVDYFRGARDGRPLLEASGGITLETIREVAQTGVDRISCGSLTHSPRALDLAMYIR